MPVKHFFNGLLEHVRRMLKFYRSISYHLYAATSRTYRHNRLLTWADYAQALVVSNLTTIIKGKYGDQNPQARIEAIWRRLYDDGIFTKCWDDTKWAFLRNCLADAGMLVEIDSSYYFNHGRHDGKAMEWYLAEQWQIALTQAKEENEGGYVSIPDTASGWVHERWRPRRAIMFPLIIDAHNKASPLTNAT